jgi:RNA polymerase sigma-70 factor (ECF subfamily)
MLHTFCDEIATESQRRLPRHLARKIDADDVVQEVFRRASKDKVRFAGWLDRDVRDYLFKILGSVIADQVRLYDRGKRRVSLERPADSPTGLIDWLAADHTSPTQKARRNEQFVRLEDALNSLPDDQRTAVKLHYFQGWSLKRTAEFMEKSVPAVAGLIRRGLETLRKRLGEPVN